MSANRRSSSVRTRPCRRGTPDIEGIGGRLDRSADAYGLRERRTRLGPGGPRTRRSAPGARPAANSSRRRPRCRVSSRDVGAARHQLGTADCIATPAFSAARASSSSAACCGRQPRSEQRGQISTAAVSPMPAPRTGSSMLGGSGQTTPSPQRSPSRQGPRGSARMPGLGPPITKEGRVRGSHESARRERGRASRCAARSSFRRSAGSRGRRRRGGALGRARHSHHARHRLDRSNTTGLPRCAARRCSPMRRPDSTRPPSVPSDPDVPVWSRIPYIPTSESA